MGQLWRLQDYFQRRLKCTCLN